MRFLPSNLLRRNSQKRGGRARDRLAVESLEDRCLLTVVTLNPIKDNTLFQSATGNVSSGAGNSIMVGQDHFVGQSMRAVMAFDVPGAIPAGATINSVTLTAWVNTTFDATTPSVELHKVLADWGEGASAPNGFMPPYGTSKTGDATWLHRFYPSQLWATPGGDFSPTVSGAKVLGPSTGTFTWTTTAQMVADVQSWLDNPAANFGWLLKGDETQESGKMIDSSESATAARRPTLTIDYSVAPAAPNMTIGDATITEGNSGTTNAQFAVTLSAASASTVTVVFATADGSAVAGQDYTAASGTLTFAPGDTTKTVTVPIMGDAVVEQSESFQVTLSNAQNANITDSQGAGSITNDDSAAFSINDVSKSEGDAGTTTFTFAVTLNAAVDAPVAIGFTTADGTATLADGDYSATSSTLNFAGTAGEMKSIAVQVNGDTSAEPDESFFVSLANIIAGGRSVTIADVQGLGTVVNDDGSPPIVLTIGDATILEGGAGTASAQFNVTMSVASSDTVTVSFATSEGTAQAGADFQNATGTLTFAPGETMKTIAVNVNGDRTVERDENFSISLSDPTNATIADGQGQGTIKNDDTATITIDDVTMAEGNSGTTDFTFTVTLNAAVDVPVSVAFATSDGSATVSDGDYAATSGTLQFTGAAGETQSITVSVNGEQTSEGTETFLLRLSDISATGRAVTIADDRGTGTITTDDSAASGIQLEGGILEIVGTDQGDRVQIRKTGRRMLEVEASFLDGSKPRRFKSSEVSRIEVTLNGGSDSAGVARDIDTPVFIAGGAGDDELHGGSGHDVLLGGPGRDQLYAGAGHNLLIGGSDSDQLSGDLSGMHRRPGSRRARRLAARSDNILIGGQTMYDANDAALQSIMTEWASRRPFSDRVNNITTGVGANGAYKLTSGDTVLDDLADDILNAGSAKAWALTSSGDEMMDRDDSGQDSSESGSGIGESELPELELE
jgi:hypothetical protein